MPEPGWSIEGDVEELCLQIESGEAADGYARLQASHLRRLRELAEAAGRVSYPLHTPQAPGDLPVEPDIPARPGSFRAWWRWTKRCAQGPDACP